MYVEHTYEIKDVKTIIIQTLQVRRVQQGSLERSFGMSPSSPPDFDFPPPPADLPPPSPSPRSVRKVNDKENNLPERLERNSKVSKFREASSDSCESLGNSQNNQVKSPMSPVSENRTLGSPAVGSLSSPGSTLDHDYKKSSHPNNTTPIRQSDNSDAIKPFVSDTIQRNMESQLLAEISLEKKSNATVAQTLKTSPNLPPQPATDIPASNADMLVSELFESFKAKSSKPTPKSLTSDAATYENTDTKPEIDFKANLRKVKKPTLEDTETSTSSANKTNTQMLDFKSNLRKKSDPSSTSSKQQGVEGSNPAPTNTESNIVDFKAKLRKSTKPDGNSPTNKAEDNSGNAEPIDFKARLRKVSDSKDKSSNSPTKESTTPSVNDKLPIDKRDSLGNNSLNAVDGTANSSTEQPPGTSDPDDNKRKSTGSISSLRKMWESSPKPNRTSNTQPPTDLDKLATTPSGDESIGKTIF